MRLSLGVVLKTAVAHDKTCVDAVSLKFGHKYSVCNISDPGFIVSFCIWQFIDLNLNGLDLDTPKMHKLSH